MYSFVANGNLPAIVRLIRNDELQKLLDLYRHFERDDAEPEDSEGLQRVWDEIVCDPNLYYIVAEKGGELISTCTIAIIKNLTRGARPYGLIENVVTHKDYRRQGLGKQVLQKAVDIAKEKNCYKVMLLTGSRKDETLRFYEKAGFARGVKTGFVMNL